MSSEEKPEEKPEEVWSVWSYELREAISGQKERRASDTLQHTIRQQISVDKKEQEQNEVKDFDK